MGAALLPPPTEGAEKEGRDREGRPTARFLVFVGPGAVALPAAFLFRSSAYSAAAMAVASEALSAIWPISVIASAGCAMMVSAKAPATAEDLAASATEALATVYVRAFLGAVTRARVTGVDTRDIMMFVTWST